jgi:hypothetical protein
MMKAVCVMGDSMSVDLSVRKDRLCSLTPVFASMLSGFFKDDKEPVLQLIMPPNCASSACVLSLSRFLEGGPGALELSDVPPLLPVLDYYQILPRPVLDHVMCTVRQNKDVLWAPKDLQALHDLREQEYVEDWSATFPPGIFQHPEFYALRGLMRQQLSVAAFLYFLPLWASAAEDAENHAELAGVYAEEYAEMNVVHVPVLDKQLVHSFLVPEEGSPVLVAPHVISKRLEQHMPILAHPDFPWRWADALVVVAGGAAMHCMCVADTRLRSSDADLFVVGKTLVGRQQMVRHLVRWLEQACPGTIFAYGASVITAIMRGAPRALQIVLTDAASPAEATCAFDMQSARAFVQGGGGEWRAWASASCLEAWIARVERGRLAPRPDARRFLRLLRRGFSIEIRTEEERRELITLLKRSSKCDDDEFRVDDGDFRYYTIKDGDAAPIEEHAFRVSKIYGQPVSIGVRNLLLNFRFVSINRTGTITPAEYFGLPVPSSDDAVLDVDALPPFTFEDAPTASFTLEDGTVLNSCRTVPLLLFETEPMLVDFVEEDYVCVAVSGERDHRLLRFIEEVRQRAVQFLQPISTEDILATNFESGYRPHVPPDLSLWRVRMSAECRFETRQGEALAHHEAAEAYRKALYRPYARLTVIMPGLYSTGPRFGAFFRVQSMCFCPDPRARHVK